MSDVVSDLREAAEQFHEGSGYEVLLRVAADEIERLQALLREACVALVNADAELSAFGHGRPLSKETALHVSDMCRRSYDAARAAGAGE